jgi:aminoglycoside phosphotransferase (APT) family kinase protein
MQSSEAEGNSKSLQEVIAGLDWQEAKLSSVTVSWSQHKYDGFVAGLTASDGEGTQHLILKRFRAHPTEPRPSSESARKEAAILERLNRVLPAGNGQVDFAAPRLILFDAEHAAVVMNRVDGEPLDRIIVAARNSRDLARADAPLRHAGSWLRGLQRGTMSGVDGNSVLAEILATAHRDLEEVTRRDRTIRRMRSSIADTLEKLRNAIAPEALQTVGCHGDFWPGNVFVADRSVQAIDFEGFHDGLPLEDVAYFLVHLEMYFKYPFLGRQFARVASAFLEGYGQPVDANALRLMLIVKGLQVLARGAVPDRSSIREWLTRRTVRRCVVRNVRG